MQTSSRSPAFDDYWRFAAKRQDVYLARVLGQRGPWTDDPIINAYRFTNTYRAADRVSQFLISDVQYDKSYEYSDEDVIFRTMLFKIFNKIETWKALERKFGNIKWSTFNFEIADEFLDEMINSGKVIYSAAYIMPSPLFGAKRKHANHLRLIKYMMEDGLINKISSRNSLSQVYDVILSYRGLGPFLAYQFAIDINYSEVIDFDENEFVVAGPGAHDGIRKCFPEASRIDAEKIIHWMVENQDEQFSRLGISFSGLFGRKLKAIDCQNLFCEISKYCRVAHPEIVGTTARSRIKQTFTAEHRANMPTPFFPPKWNLQVNLGDRITRSFGQLELYN